MMRRSLVSHGVLLVSLFVAGRASAVETQACLEASQKGQDARDSGKLIESRLYFTTCADAACPRPVPSYCLDWIKDVSRRIPSLVIRVTDAQGRDLVDVTTKIDGVTIGTKLDGRPVEVKPGNHRIELESGGARTEQTLLVVESEKGRVITAKLDTGGRALPVATTAVTTPELPAAASDRPVPVTSWVAWGVGAVALVAFGVFGLKAKSDFDGYQSTCGTRCTNDDRDSVKGTVLVADVMLTVGVVAVGVGTVFYLTRPTAARRVGRLSQESLTNGIRW